MYEAGVYAAYPNLRYNLERDLCVCICACVCAWERERGELNKKINNWENYSNEGMSKLKNLKKITLKKNVI